MPGFGKSGTLRIFALSVVVVVVIEGLGSWSVEGLRQDPEVVRASARRRLVHDHVVHARSRRTAADGALETEHRVGVALHLDLHAAVVEIAHGTVHAFTASRVEREVAKADALHPSGDDHAPRDEHEPLIIAATVTE